MWVLVHVGGVCSTGMSRFLEGLQAPWSLLKSGPHQGVFLTVERRVLEIPTSTRSLSRVMYFRSHQVGGGGWEGVLGLLWPFWKP